MFDIFRKSPEEASPTNQVSDKSNIEAKYNEIQHDNQVSQNGANPAESHSPNINSFAGNENAAEPSRVSAGEQNKLKLPPIYNTPEPSIQTADTTASSVPSETPVSKMTYDVLGNPVIPQNPDPVVENAQKPLEQVKVSPSLPETPETSVETPTPEVPRKEVEAQEPPAEVKKMIQEIEDEKKALEDEKSKLLNQKDGLEEKIAKVDQEIVEKNELKKKFENSESWDLIKYVENRKSVENARDDDRNEAKDNSEKSEESSINNHSESPQST